jgi:hypothetical protein
MSNCICLGCMLLVNGLKSSKVVFFLLPLYSLAIGGMQENVYCHPPTSSMVMLLTLAEVSSGVVGRLNRESNFVARIVS